jgi:hypothetical protein
VTFSVDSSLSLGRHRPTGAESNGSQPQCRDDSPWQEKDASPAAKKLAALEQDAFESSPTELPASAFPFESHSSTLDNHLRFLHVYLDSERVNEDAAVSERVAAETARSLKAGTLEAGNPQVASFSQAARFGQWLVKQVQASARTRREQTDALTQTFEALLSSKGLRDHQRGAVAQGMVMGLTGDPSLRDSFIHALHARGAKLDIQKLGLFGLRTFMLTASVSEAPHFEERLRQQARALIASQRRLPTEVSSPIGQAWQHALVVSVLPWVTGLHSVVGISKNDWAPVDWPRSPTARLNEDGQYRINVVSEGARDSSVRAVQEALSRVSFPPEVASFLDGWTVAIVPEGRTLNDDPYAFLMGVTEAGRAEVKNPPMGLSSSSSRGVTLRDQVVTAGRQGAAIHEEGLVHYELWDLPEAKKQAMREKDNKPTFWTLFHELGHAIRRRYLAQLGPDDERLKPFVKHLIPDDEVAKMGSGEDVLRWHFESRLKAGELKDLPGCYLNMEAWFAELVARYLSDGPEHDAFRRQDEQMFFLLGSLLGTRRPWKESADLGWWVSEQVEHLKRNEPSTMTWEEARTWSLEQFDAELRKDIDTWRAQNGMPSLDPWTAAVDSFTGFFRDAFGL